jgi:sterol 3beta-glucosyltransferase
MRIAILSYGTRGDVQPLVAIGLALQARGHDVILAAPENHVSFVEKAGLRAASLAGDSEVILNSEEGRRWVQRGDTRSLMGAVVHTFKARGREVEADAEAACAGADVIVSGILAAGVARLFSEVLGVPMVLVHTFPGPPTTAFHNAVVDVPLGLPGPLRLLVSKAVLKVTWHLLHEIDDEARRRRGLPLAAEDPIAAQARAKRPNLCLWSPTLLPKPADWGDATVVTGFCALPSQSRDGLGEAGRLAELSAFLDDGEPPLYMGLGSMPLLDPRPVLDRFLKVAEGLQCRVVVGGTFSDPAAVRASLPSWARLSGAVDHDALFARCKAVLHHGGAGSTATSLRAGKATVVCAVLGDQYFWGRVVDRAGVGAALPFQKLSDARLRRTLERAVSDDVTSRARAMGQRMREEPAGGDVAANAIEAFAA